MRDLSTPEGRAGLLRRLRALADEGLVDLTWTLLGAAVGPRYERRLWVTPAGEAAAARARGPGSACRGVRSGRARSRRWPSSPGDAACGATGASIRGRRVHAADGVPAAPLAERHGASAIAGLVRRGLLRAEVRERPRRPLAGRPAGLRGARPAGSDLTDAQAAALAIVGEAIERRDPTPTLLDGVTGGGKTAIYVEAIAACLAAERPALLLVPEIALATPDRRPAPRRPPRPRRARSTRRSARASVRTSGDGSGPARPTSSSGRGSRSSRRSPTSAS